MKHFLFIPAIILILFTGCSSGKNRLDVDVTGISVPSVKIHRYDLDLFKVDPENLQKGLLALKPAYPFFLDTDLSDPLKLSDMQQYLENPRNIESYEAVSAKFQSLEKLEKGLDDAFRHLRYYDSKFIIPRVYTYISGGDYEFPVQFADSVLLIGLDNYLGRDFKPFMADGLPAYRIARMNAGNILPDCIRVLMKVTYPAQLSGNTLLENMIEAGKRLYLVDAIIPDEPDMLKIGYPEIQYNWIVKNEKQVWSAIISNGLLYTTDGKLIRSFMADGPFTAEFSKDAPARLGEWLGWQIVSAYMERHPEITLDAMMEEKDAQKILSMSGYKP
jgi:hypothetical protein